MDFTGFGQVSCDTTRECYNFDINNFFVSTLTDFLVRIDCNGDAVPSVYTVTVPGLTNSAESVGRRCAGSSGGGVSNRLCKLELLMRNPAPTSTSSDEYITLDTQEPLMCGDVVIDYDRRDAIKVALDDDDHSAWDLQASFEDGRLSESPWFTITIAVVVVLGIAIIGASTVAQHLRDIVQVQSDASNGGSSKAREQASDTVASTRTKANNGAGVNSEKTYLANGGGAGVMPGSGFSGGEFHASQSGGEYSVGVGNLASSVADIAQRRIGRRVAYSSIESSLNPSDSDLLA